MKKIHFPQLMFITNYQSKHSHIQQVEQAVKAGIKWIQYRPKNVDYKQIIKEGKAISKICKTNNVCLILNDNVNLVKEINADGVHIGQKDLSADLARKKLGNNLIIGGTANTTEDVISMVNKGADYIGLGPFSYTETKKKLSPILGLNGYSKIITELKNKNIKIPIYAIGGIQINDIPNIMKIGVTGIAVSSLLSEDNNIKQTLKNINFQ